MRSLIVVALLAFLAVGFVAARPAEEAVESAVEEVADGDDTVASSDAEETQDADAEESTDEDGENSEAAEENENAGEANEESGNDDAEEDETPVAPPKKQVRPFWPRFGGHGPVVIPRRALLLSQA